jgi:hypothetical protein
VCVNGVTAEVNTGFIPSAREGSKAPPNTVKYVNVEAKKLGSVYFEQSAEVESNP